MSINSIQGSIVEKFSSIGKKIVNEVTRPQFWGYTAIAVASAGAVGAVGGLMIGILPFYTAVTAALILAAVSLSIVVVSFMFFLGRSFARSIEKDDQQRDYANRMDGNKFFVGGKEITDPNQIKILSQFSPKAQKLIVNYNLFDPKNPGVSWHSYELSQFTSREIPLLLEHFGDKFRSLRFPSYPDESPLELIDLSNCTKLEDLGFDDQKFLRTIEGLEQCENLESIRLGRVPAMDEGLLMEQLNKIPNPAIKVYCHSSSLMVDATLEEAKEKFEPDGIWGRFLQAHPRCTIVDLFNHVFDFLTLVECATVIKNQGFQLKNCAYETGRYDIVPIASATNGPETPKLVVNRVTITDPKQIEILRKFSPAAQECIVHHGLFSNDTKDLVWTGEVLQHFYRKEIQHLLNYFGEKFGELNFEDYAPQWPLESIDFSNCPNLEILGLANQKSLEFIGGLEKCPKLEFITLRGCVSLDQMAVAQQLNGIQNQNIMVYCGGSSLTVETIDDMQTKFVPGGIWAQFLKSHPGCTLHCLVKMTANEAMKSTVEDLLEPLGFKLTETETQPTAYDIEPKNPRWPTDPEGWIN